MILWLVFIGALSVVQGAVKDVALARPDYRGAGKFEFESVSAMEAYLGYAHELQLLVAKMAGFLSLYRLFIAQYTIMLLFRFFQAFNAQPRLAVVTKTVLSSFTDFVHFFVVSCLTLNVFVVHVLVVVAVDHHTGVAEGCKTST